MLSVQVEYDEAEQRCIDRVTKATSEEAEKMIEEASVGHRRAFYRKGCVVETIKQFTMAMISKIWYGDAKGQEVLPPEVVIIPPAPVFDETAQTLATAWFNAFRKYVHLGGLVSFITKMATSLALWTMILEQDRTSSTQLFWKLLFVLVAVAARNQKMACFL